MTISSCERYGYRHLTKGLMQVLVHSPKGSGDATSNMDI
jgi:hypothetical protein